MSSGLVAVAWMAADEGGDLEFNTINKFSCGRTEGMPLVGAQRRAVRRAARPVRTSAGLEGQRGNQ